MAQAQTGPPAAHAVPAHEQAALDQRRRRSGVDPARPRLGLALSGGGVRSATFCLGLLRALAKRGVLLRFDYLSTVSGGGYAGAAYGRLFRPGVEPADVEKGLANDRSVLLWWLRSNGRYLVPAGARDLLQTWAGQLRGLIATQFDITILFAVLACTIVLPHLLGFPRASLAAASALPSLWLWLMPVAAWIAVFTAFAYWWARDPEDGSLWIDALICIATAAAGVGMLGRLGAVAPGSQRTAMLSIALILLAIPVAWLRLRIPPLEPARERVHYTVALSGALKILLLLLVLGAADLGTWFVANQVQRRLLSGSVLTSAGLAAMLVGVARLALPMLQSQGNKKTLAQLPLALMANLCGLILVALLALFWLTALQFFVFVAKISPLDSWMHWLTWLFPRLLPGTALDTWLRWLTVLLPCLAFVLLTGGNLQQINRSSLHAFYRSRLARSYVSTGNSPPAVAEQVVRFPVSPLQSRDAGNVTHTRKLTELLPGDDVPLTEYAPYRHGGPIHLINCCINQTVDDRTDTYNADRKGVYLTVSSLGLEAGRALPLNLDPAHDPLVGSSLAEWVAISGAAAGSGMGSLTRTGTAALFFLSGFRLGYWWRNRANMRSLCWSRLGKPRAALQEMLARFPGLRSPVWYLSDGGHFDNTGVYSLLKRRLGVIVLADCGADPSYVFTDLENLVRKARIDLDTTIEFIDPESLPPGLDAHLQARFGTPDSIMPTPGNQHLLLARISYPDGPSGCLLVVKPRLYCELPLDVAGYSDRHRDFPQQSTSDQFFDEAQWESYCQLGELLGLPIDAHLLDLLPALASAGAPTRASAVSADDQKSTMTRRQRFGATLGASLSLGALATVLATGWQAWQTHVTSTQGSRQDRGETQREIDSLQTSLDADAVYDGTMHGRLYALLQKFNHSRGSTEMVKAMNQLGVSLNHACGTLDSTNPLNDKCRSDLYALQAVGNEPGGWQVSMIAYRDATPARPAVDIAPSRIRTTVHAAPPPVAPASPPAGATAAASRTTVAAEPASGATAPLAPAGPAAVPAVRATCSGAASRSRPIILYTQIYSENQHAVAERALRNFRRFGLTVHSVQNVGQLAERNDRAAPIPWHKPVFLYSSYNDQAQQCAQALATWLATEPDFVGTSPTALPLPVRLRGNPDVIEFWIPAPRDVPAGDRGSP